MSSCLNQTEQSAVSSQQDILVKHHGSGRLGEEEWRESWGDKSHSHSLYTVSLFWWKIAWNGLTVSPSQGRYVRLSVCHLRTNISLLESLELKQ